MPASLSERLLRALVIDLARPSGAQIRALIRALSRLAEALVMFLLYLIMPP